MRLPRRLLSLVLLSACGQSADVVGHRNDVPPPPEDTGWQTDFEACATEHAEAALVPTSLFLAVDTSCSMADPADGSATSTATTAAPSKWDEASSAFTTFFADPSSATLQAALRLWPTTTDGCNGDATTGCVAADCAIPQVPLGLIGDTAQQQALTAALTGTTPNGNTPMYAALEGARLWAADRRTTVPQEQVAIVFVTDGEPNGCDEDIGDISGIASTSLASGVPVYVVGIEGSNTAQIDQIAAAGGTTNGYYVGSANAEADLLAALDDIQSQVLSCRYQFPAESTTAGEPLSPDLVRVEYTDASGNPQSIGRVADASACGPDGGWYLDDPSDPTTITLCPTTCTELQGIETVSIDIDVGCECVSDDDCPGDDVCTSQGCVAPCEGPQCGDLVSDGVAVVGQEAVQGGALNCETAPGPAGLGLLLGALAAARIRRGKS